MDYPGIQAKLTNKKKQQQNKSCFTPNLREKSNEFSVQMNSKASRSYEPFSATNIIIIHDFTVGT